MRRFILYFAGGLACLGIGAYFYSALPSANIILPSSSQTALSAGGNATSLVGTDESLGTDNSTALLQNDENKMPPTTEPVSSIIFAGDIMLGRSVAGLIKTNGSDYPFAKIKDIISSADEAIANLEGPLTAINNDPTNLMRFHFDPALANELSGVGFDAVSLANNHSLDQGSEGLADTKKNLTAVGIKYFGDPARADGNVYYFTADGKKIAVIGFQMVYGNLDPAGYAKAISDAKKNADVVIVMPHWGIEYQHIINQTQKSFAHQFIDAGADIVVGSHPHVVEGIEIYKNKPIFYSLGNLVFDQYFSTDTQEGMMIRLNFIGDKETIYLLPYNIPHSQPVLADGAAKAKMLQGVASWSDPELKDQIIAGSIKF
jgi:poly-gamma-glutamate capsule biosynthesis protein CapA/YwtB (metallophosphatase superfamily)